MTSAELVISGFRQNQPIALPELISALTFALDLTEDAAPGHGLRCCLLGMQMAEALGLPEEQLTPLYYSLLLKDVGCSNNSARMAQVVGGDDRVVKGVAKLADWTSIVRSSDLRTIRLLWNNVLPDASPIRRAARLAVLGLHQRRNNREMIELRCERGSEIIRKLKMGDAAAEAVLRLDEHWDGSGYPGCLRGEEIPLLARLCTIAQSLDIFACIDGHERAIAVLRKRKGTWFDPRLVDVAERLHAHGNLWNCTVGYSLKEMRQIVMDIGPGSSDPLMPSHIDTICEGFADVVDAKSPFTYRHSLHVADVAEALAKILQLSSERQRTLRRTALLHDLGKLRVPNTILDKRGPLTEDEWEIVRKHPTLSRSILERVSSFGELAVLAAEHHEKLDGSGYPRGLMARDMTLESRILAISDQFAGMTEQRPYHPGYDLQEALDLLRKSVPAKLDATCFEALCALAASPAPEASHSHVEPERDELSVEMVEAAC